MRTISTISELRSVWKTLSSLFARDPYLAWKFIETPDATLKEMGYSLQPDMRAVLQQCLTP